jgi:hypothetical protein
MEVIAIIIIISSSSSSSMIANWKSSHRLMQASYTRTFRYAFVWLWLKEAG